MTSDLGEFSDLIHVALEPNWDQDVREALANVPELSRIHRASAAIAMTSLINDWVDRTSETTHTEGEL